MGGSYDVNIAINALNDDSASIVRLDIVDYHDSIIPCHDIEQARQRWVEDPATWAVIARIINDSTNFLHQCHWKGKLPPQS